jgi:acetyl esterase/lipase
MKTLSFLLFSFFMICLNSTNAQEITSLYPAKAPGETGQLLVESSDTSGRKVAGETVNRVTNVSSPAITIYRPAEELSCNTAVIVCPGGGYNILAYDLEGEEVCDWLNRMGITAVLLKYRVPRREGLEKHTAPLQDAQRAVSYVRSLSDELNIKSDKIGIMGFSAGAHLSVMTSTSFDNRTYQAIDERDNFSPRPDFCLLVYPAYLDGENITSLSPEIKIKSNTPPTFITQAQDDNTFINSSLAYYYALKETNIPVTMHLYDKGGHGFGIRDTKADANEWPDRAETWLRNLNFIK